MIRATNHFDDIRERVLSRGPLLMLLSELPNCVLALQAIANKQVGGVIWLTGRVASSLYHIHSNSGRWLAVDKITMALGMLALDENKHVVHQLSLLGGILSTLVHSGMESKMAEHYVNNPGAVYPRERWINGWSRTASAFFGFVFISNLVHQVKEGKLANGVCILTAALLFLVADYHLAKGRRVPYYLFHSLWHGMTAILAHKVFTRRKKQGQEPLIPGVQDLVTHEHQQTDVCNFLDFLVRDTGFHGITHTVFGNDLADAIHHCVTSFNLTTQAYRLLRNNPQWYTTEYVLTPKLTEVTSSVRYGSWTISWAIVSCLYNLRRGTTEPEFIFHHLLVAASGLMGCLEVNLIHWFGLAGVTELSSAVLAIASLLYGHIKKAPRSVQAIFFATFVTVRWGFLHGYVQRKSLGMDVRRFTSCKTLIVWRAWQGTAATLLALNSWWTYKMLHAYLLPIRSNSGPLSK